MNIIVRRDFDDGFETLGKLHVDTGIQILFECETLELPDKNNSSQISCIPKGNYDWVKVGASANIPYNHISILNVEHRSGICIHAANYYTQLRGCIAVGKKRTDINGDGQEDITESKKTFEKLMSILPDSGKLIII